jgi:glycosyltransferase involved in cell wall biosynthesis
MTSPLPVIVVPCYNEAGRLDREAFAAFAAAGRARLLLVDDGSRDATARVLDDLRAAAPDNVGVLGLERNQGKAEAVRLGLLRALGEGATVVAYADADLSTPFDEVLRVVTVVTDEAAEVALGSRVARMGADIRRRPARHYLGRVFATGASWVLEAVVYDTQCGAKCFRDSPALRAALDAPFLSRWAFDVELLGRLLTGAPGVAALDPAVFLEVPLARWRDVAGSKLRAGAMAGALADLLRIRADLRRRARLAPPRGGLQP